jgi:hypothetical protein
MNGGVDVTRGLAQDLLDGRKEDGRLLGQDVRDGH